MCDFWSDFRFSLSFRSFIGIRWFKRLDLRLEALFLFNQLEQDFDTVKFDFSPDLYTDLVSFAVWVSLLCLIWFFLQTGVLQLNFLVRSSYLIFTRASLLDCLCMLLFVCDRIPVLRSVLLRVFRICRSSARQVTHWSYPFITQFYALVTTLTHCMIRIS